MISPVAEYQYEAMRRLQRLTDSERQEFIKTTEDALVRRLVASHLGLIKYGKLSRGIDWRAEAQAHIEDKFPEVGMSPLLTEAALMVTEGSVMMEAEDQ